MLKHIVLSAAALLGLSGAAQSAVVYDLDRLSFEAAIAGSPTVYSFDFSTDVAATDTLALTPQIVITSVGNDFTVSGGQFQGNVNGSVSVGSTASSTQEAFQDWSFAPDTYFFGFDYIGSGPKTTSGQNTERLRITLVTATGNFTFAVPDLNGTQGGFVGFTSDSVITGVRFDGTSEAGRRTYWLDNVLIADAPVGAVPLPASFGFGLIGVGALALMRRRKARA